MELWSNPSATHKPHRPRSNPGAVFFVQTYKSTTQKNTDHRATQRPREDSTRKKQPTAHGQKRLFVCNTRTKIFLIFFILPGNNSSIFVYIGVPGKHTGTRGAQAPQNGRPGNRASHPPPPDSNGNSQSYPRKPGADPNRASRDPNHGNIWEQFPEIITSMASGRGEQRPYCLAVN